MKKNKKNKCIEPEEVQEEQEEMEIDPFTKGALKGAAIFGGIVGISRFFNR